ncbi:hypothetical protein ACFFGT_06230 [Mucilaginibacter angelicae]|uniref:Uncharacterized protein n=1 Tax=Mucilaginibacter angelicae TaxID=869718 RepID=A0ABV6L2A6_9SPHI
MELTTRPLIGEISEADAQKMVAAYGADAKGVSKSVWFGLDQIDQLTTLLKAESLIGAGTDGLRVYFAQYTQDTLNGMDPSNEGKNTVVFVSTRKAVDENNKEFHEDYFEGLQLPIHAIPENRGELCQPQCAGTKL